MNHPFIMLAIFVGIIVFGGGIQIFDALHSLPDFDEGDDEDIWPADDDEDIWP